MLEYATFTNWSTYTSSSVALSGWYQLTFNTVVYSSILLMAIGI